MSLGGVRATLQTRVDLACVKSGDRRGRLELCVCVLVVMEEGGVVTDSAAGAMLTKT